jgi:DNA-binding response OmpR family regulator
MRKLMDVNGKILIADDEKINVDFFQVMLTKLGFDVEVAYNGEQVLKKVMDFTPDLILLDLLMPKLSGYKVVEIMKNDEKTKNIPIIVLTAVNDIKDKVEMIELGIEDYITKPFNFVEILARIRNTLRAKFLKDEMDLKERKLGLMREFVGSINTFLEESSVSSKEIMDLLEGIKKKSYGKDSHIQDMGKALTYLIKKMNKFKKTFELYNKKTSQRG